MRHHKSIRKFGREKNQRKALIRSLARSLILREKIKTTEAKAKELRPYVEKLITRSKKNDLSSKRLIFSRLGGEKETQKLFEKIGPRYIDRNGGYLRITKLPRRMLDSAKLAQIEFV